MRARKERLVAVREAVEKVAARMADVRENYEAVLPRWSQKEELKIRLMEMKEGAFRS